VPAPSYPIDLTAATATAPIRARNSGDTAGDGASSISF
jgi:hypothetical protein